jgi:hypothetical protein
LNASSVVLNVSQNVLSLVNAHAFGFAGDSPNHSATCACTSGEVIQSNHMYMQLGFLAFDAIIHVSDHAVEPSFGSTASTVALSALARLMITCQVVPSTVVPCSMAAWALV